IALQKKGRLRGLSRNDLQAGSVPHAPVVLGAINAAAVAVVGALHLGGLAQGVAARFHAVGARLVAFGATEFAVAQRAVLDAIVQALFLVDVALHVRLFHVGFQRIGVAGLCVVFLVVHGRALAILFALDLRAFRSGERTVAQVALLGLVDARFAGLELARFAGGELAGLQSLLDALLLVDVTPGFAGGVVRPRRRG